MRSALRAWRRFYGDHPLHLLTMIGCFALVGYIVALVSSDPSAITLLIWFLGAVIAHDLVLYPLYALADRPLVLTRGARRNALPHRSPRVPMINQIRVPAMGSALLLIVFFPTVTARGQEGFASAAAHDSAGYIQNWLLVTAVLFLASAAVYAVRLGTAARHGRPRQPGRAQEGSEEITAGTSDRTTPTA